MMRMGLILLVCTEVLVAGAAIAQRLGQPTPPVLNDARLDDATAADLQRLRWQAGASAGAWRQLAEGCLGFGYFPEAEACYRRARELQPRDFPIEYGLAYSLQRLGRLDEAIKQFELAATLGPTEMVRTCWYHIGRCQLRKENVAAAEVAFRKCGSFAQAALLRAKILIRTDRQDEAAHLLDSLLRDLPNAIQPLELKAAVEEIRGHEQSAWELRTRSDRSVERLALADHHDFLTPIRFRFGVSRLISENVNLIGRGRQQEAAQGLHAILADLDATDQRRMVPTLAELELQLGHPETAVGLLDDFFEQGNVTPELLMTWGDAQNRLDRRAIAVQAWERAVRMRPSLALHGRLAEHYEEIRDAKQARHHTARGLYHGGVDALRADKPEAAHDALQHAVQLDPNHDRSWYSLAESLRVLGKPDESKTAYERCLQLNPAHGRAWAALHREERERPAESSPSD